VSGTDVLAVAAREVREFAKIGLREDSPRRRLRLLERSPLLRSLQPVQAAGQDSRAQFEYLVQAIIDAIDEIGRTVSMISAVPYNSLASEGNREAQALRALFGLTDRTRITTWRVRQEAAAICLNVSWDHFRHDIQEPLLRSLAECILHAVLSAGPWSSGLISPTSGLSAIATQRDIEDSVIEYIREMRPQSAAMLELSTSTEGPILRALRDVGAHIRLLVANPDRFFSDWQGPRIRRSLHDLVRTDFHDYDALSLRLYGAPPSLRGRRIGEIITVGWFTHRDNKRLDLFDPANDEVWGHDNAVVVGGTAESSGATLSLWFEREFERLWSHRSTRDQTESAQILDLAD
jgi:hypothetical protein